MDSDKQTDEEEKYVVQYFPPGSPQREFMNDLKHIYVLYKKCQALSRMLTDCFEKSSDPYFACLSIAYNSFDYSLGKLSSLTYTVLEVFANWSEPRASTLDHLLTKNMKINAFKVASEQKNRTIGLHIVKTYRLRESNFCFINNIRDMIEKHKYKEACELVKILNLEENFDIYDFLVPLFLQDKLNVIAEFLVDNTDYQNAFISFLDSLIIEHNLSSRVSKLISDLKMPDIPINILCKLYNKKALNRYIKKLLADFKIPKDVVPNYLLLSENKTVSYLIHKRFGDKSLNDESFRELVIDLVTNNDTVSREFLLKLAQVGAYSEVIHWCQVLNVPVSEMPQSVQDYHCNMQSGKTEADQSIDDDWEVLNAENYHTLMLPPSALSFISTETQLKTVIGFLNEVIQTKTTDNSINSCKITDETSKNLTNGESIDCDSKIDKCNKALNDECVKTISTDLESTSLSHGRCEEKDVNAALQAANRSLLLSGGTSLVTGAASLVSGGASIVSGGVSLVSGTASLVCSGASVVSGGASVVSTGVSLVTGRASLVSAGASLVAGGASFMTGGSSLVSSGVSLVSGTASVVSGGVSLVSGSASLVSGAASIVAGSVSKVANRARTNSESNQLSVNPFIDASLKGPNNVSLVAFDCEWKPPVGGNSTGLSLLQLATPTSVYILDMISLTPSKQNWDHLVSGLFKNQQILKIGFGMHSDITCLSSYFKCDSVNFGCGLLDLADLWTTLSNEYNIEFPYSNEYQETGYSLSRLVYLCLGKNLDKKERLSNWELRPLRESQVQYAALDAYSLVEIYSVLRNLCLKRNLPFDDIVNEMVLKYKERMSRKKKKQEEGSRSQTGAKPKGISVLNQMPISVNSVCLVCDCIMIELAKKLRRCGISVSFFGSLDKTEDIIKKAIIEQKTVLVTKETVYNKMKDELPPQLLYKIKTANPENQFIEVVNYFNILINDEDKFSRCLDCNSHHMKKCSKEDVEYWRSKPKEQVSAVECSVPAGYEDAFEDDDDYYDDEDSADNYNPGSTVFQTVTTKFGCPIKVNVPDSVLEKVNTYHLCESCGNIFWNEGQFDEILGTLNSSFVSS